MPNNQSDMGENSIYNKKHRQLKPDTTPIADNIRRMQPFSCYPADAGY